MSLWWCRGNWHCRRSRPTVRRPPPVPGRLTARWCGRPSQQRRQHGRGRERAAVGGSCWRGPKSATCWPLTTIRPAEFGKTKRRATEIELARAECRTAACVLSTSEPSPWCSHAEPVSVIHRRSRPIRPRMLPPCWANLHRLSPRRRDCSCRSMGWIFRVSPVPCSVIVRPSGCRATTPSE